MVYKQAVMMNGFDINKCEFDLSPRGANKPSRALWTSTYKDNPSNIGWIEWCYYNMPNWIEDELYLLIPKPETNVYEINTIDDYLSEELIKLSVYDNPMGPLINYQAMCNKGYDGIHFSSRAAALGHSFMFDDKLTWDVSLALNAIDCESTVWFNTNWVSSVGRITNTLKNDVKLYMEVEIS